MSTVRITLRAVEIFRQMQPLETRCECTETQECDACDQWWKLHGRLSKELGLKPWQFPAIELPAAVDVSAPGTAGAIWLPRAKAIYLALAEASMIAAS